MSYTKAKYIERFGEEAWEQERTRRNNKKKEYYEKNKDRILNHVKEYREENPDIVKERKKRYYQKNKERIKAKTNSYYHENRETILPKLKRYREENAEKVSERKRVCTQKYRDTKAGRAKHLVDSYTGCDKSHNRGECSVTVQWIVEHIFGGSCIYCGETDWKKLGCDRIDNTKAHTPDNCVCACKSCNTKRGVTPFREFLLSQNPSGSSEILSSLGLLI